MKKEKRGELTFKTEQELRAYLRELREDLFKARISLAQGKLKNVRILRTIRDDIARAELVRNKKRSVKNA